MTNALGSGARAGLYWRQSVDEENGIQRQQKRTRALAKAREYVVVATYEDNATSASKTRNAAKWGQLLEDAAAKRIDVVIAVDVDRLLRSITDLADLMKTGVRVLTVDGEIDLTSADGELRATMLAAVARFEVRRKSERQKRANEQRAAKGLRVGGRRPFGYEKDGVTVRPGEAEAILLGYQMIARSESLGAVARSWNASGFTTGQNKRLTTSEIEAGVSPVPSPWTRTGVRQVLLNRRNIGDLVYLGEVQSVRAEWDPILNGDNVQLFEQVRSILEDPGRRKPGRNPVGLLTGIATCGVCGATVHAGGNARKGVRGYRCAGSTGHFARMAEPVEDYVSRIIIRRLARKDAVTLLSPSTSVNSRKLRTRERQIREKLESLAVEFAQPDSALTASQLNTASRALQKQLVAIQAELADAGRVDLLGDLIGLGVGDAAEREAAVHQVWKGLSVERQRAVVEELLDIALHPPGRGSRTFRPETVSITWTGAK
ncbi:MAG: recombinase family protein [Microbacteriaceae bacterium]